MRDLLLTHGYFLYEDPKEIQIQKPYVPLGILYICSHLRSKGLDVDVFDTTFSTMDELTRTLQGEPPSVLGVYANLMTRKRVVEILCVARACGWQTVVGGPEPGAYVEEYLEAGADVVVLGEGEATMEELLPALRAGSESVGSPFKRKMDWSTALRKEFKSPILMPSRGPLAKPLIFAGTCRPGGMRMARAHSRLLPRGDAPIVASGVVTRCSA
jgi:radical SAM superfamily enzyme YgiQ (UPF0313 family)